MHRGDEFGLPVSLSGDTVAIGARRNADAGMDTGSAYIFTRSSETWTQQAKLVASDERGGARFGASVSVFGNVAVIGANGAGSAYVFNRVSGAWLEAAKLTAGSVWHDEFGCSVSVWNDVLVVGADWTIKGDSGLYSGAAMSLGW